MRISDWSSDVCSSDLLGLAESGGRSRIAAVAVGAAEPDRGRRVHRRLVGARVAAVAARRFRRDLGLALLARRGRGEAIFDLERLFLLARAADARAEGGRSEEHTSELQFLLRISYAVFCLKKKR